MDVQSRSCKLYVDYDGLLVSLSHASCFDRENIVLDLLARAKQQFQIIRSVALGSWPVYSERLRLEERGLLCRSFSGAASQLRLAIQSDCLLWDTHDENRDAVLLISGQLTDNELLHSLHSANYEVILWTIEQPSENNQALCSAWECIPLPVQHETLAWPRQVMLQAIALVAASILGPAQVPLDAQQLHDTLQQLHPFQEHAWEWLIIAQYEHMLVQQRMAVTINESVFYLRREHSLVQDAFNICERVLSTIDVLSVHHQWVAFSTLEKALSSTWLLAVEQRTRHAWLELLVALDILASKCITQSKGPFQVTTLQLQEHHPLMLLVRAQPRRNLTRLILIMQHYLDSHRTQRVPIAYLLRTLTGILTRVETRSTLIHAEQQGIITISKLMPRHNQHAPTIVHLQQTHSLVREILTSRASTLHYLAKFLAERPSGASADLLASTLQQDMHQSEGDAHFWITLLQEEGLLQKRRIALSPEDAPFLLYNWQDTSLYSVSDRVTSVKEDE